MYFVTSHIVNSHFVNSHFVSLTKLESVNWELTKEIDKVGRYRVQPVADVYIILILVRTSCYLCIPHLTVLTCKSVLSHKLIGFICLHFNTLYRFVGHVLSKFNPLFILWICLLKWIRRWYCLLLLVKDGECESFEHQINLNARMLEWKVKSRIYQTVKICANFGIPKKWQLYITLGLC